jgi:hypothetical protein
MPFGEDFINEDCRFSSAVDEQAVDTCPRSIGFKQLLVVLVGNSEGGWSEVNIAHLIVE